MRWKWSLIVLAGCRQIFGISDPVERVDAGFPADTRADATVDAPLSTAGPVVSFACDLLNSNTTPDSSGHNHNGVCENQHCPMLIPGHLGGALKFGSMGGVPYALDIAASTDFDFRSGFAVSFWIDLQQSPVNQGCPLTQESVFEICINPSGTISYVPSGAGGGILTSTKFLELGLFTQVVVNVTNNRAAIYLDGAADGVTDEPSPPLVASNLVVGTDLDTSSALPAALDQFLVYARPLTLNEITALAQP